MTEYRLDPTGFNSTFDFHKDRETADHLNQPAHRPRLLNVAAVIQSIDPPPTSWIDYGCGNGGLLTLADIKDKKGFDFQPANITAAQELGRPVSFLNFVEADLEYAELVTMTEVLEHMDDPHGFLKRLPCKTLVATVPNGETPDSHSPEHVWGWDMDGFAAMVTGAGFTVEAHWADGWSQYLIGEKA